MKDVAISTDPEEMYVLDDSLEAVFRVDLTFGDRTILSDAANGAGPVFEEVHSIFSFNETSILVLDGPFPSITKLISVDRVTGDRTIIAGDGVGTGPIWSFAFDIALEPDGNIVIATTNGIIRVNPDTGERSTVSSSTVGTGPAFVNLGSIAVEPFGNIFATIGFTGEVIRIDPVTGDRTLVTGPGNVNAPNVLLTDVTVFGNEVYVHDNVASIYRVDTFTGDYTTITSPITGSGPLMEGPIGMFVLPLLFPPYCILSIFVNDLIYRIETSTGERSVWFQPPAATLEPGTTITVNSANNPAIPADAECTLREALTNANTNMELSGGDCAAGTGKDVIAFDIPGPTDEVKVIDIPEMGSDLPAITEAVTIDGYSQPGSVVQDTTGGFQVSIVLIHIRRPNGVGLLVGGSDITLRGISIDEATTAILMRPQFEAFACTSNTIEGMHFGFIRSPITFNLSGVGNTTAIESYDCSNNVIGGLSQGSANEFLSNGTAIQLTPATRDAATGGLSFANAIVGNSFFFNAVDIDLNDDGLTPNDAGDVDETADIPNRGQNSPELLNAFITEDGELRVQYRVDTDRTNADYPLLIELYAGPQSGPLSGLILLRRDNYLTPGLKQEISLGSAESVQAVTLTDVNIVVGRQLTATATDAFGNTSEFSAGITVIDAPNEADLALSNEFTAYDSTTTDIMLTYELHNLGPALAESIVVSDSMTAGAQVVMATPTQGTYDALTGQWDVGSLMPDSSASLLITISTPAPGDLNHSIQITNASVGDLDLTNNADTVTVIPEAADLELEIEQIELEIESLDDGGGKSPFLRDRVIVRKRSKTKNKGPGRAGRAMNKTGSNAQEGIEIQFTIPRSFRAVPGSLSLDPAEGTSYDDDTRTWTIESLDVNEEATIDLEWEWIVDDLDELDDLLAADGTLPIAAEIVFSEQPDPDSSPEDSDGDEFALEVLSIKAAVNVDIESDSEFIPSGFELMQNYPNPFTHQTTIPFEMAEAGEVTLQVFDLLGREVQLLYKGVLLPGRHEVTWRPQGIASGMYLLRMEAQGALKSRTMIVLK